MLDFAVILFDNNDILANAIAHAKLRSWQDGKHAMIYLHLESIASARNKFIIKS